MQISVWDTYVKRQDETTMHFDILVESSMTDEKKIFDFGRNYLKKKPFTTEKLTAKECLFCHIEEASEAVEKAIESKGYYIIEMENCD